ncbi:MAG: bifunctional riboflavin kinase/FAD synthetase [candidate division WOR-3 bacterium]
MNTIFDDFYKIEKINVKALTVGCFDGIHLGHLKIIEELAKEKPNMIITFSPHPKVFIESKRDFILTTEEEKIEIIKRFDIDYLLFLKFNESFKNLSYKEFLSKIKEKFSPKRWIAGPDHLFGKEKKGDTHSLLEFCIKNSIILTIIPYEKIEDKKISSSLLRKILKEGKVKEYKKFAGRDYEVEGEVIKGKGIGNKIGFPTANIRVKEEKILPKEGVYMGEVIIKNNKYPAGICVGKSITFGGKDRDLEVHIIDYKGNIYGERIKIIFKEFLREKEKFECAEELKERIKKDIEKIREAIYGKSIKTKNNRKI